MKPKWKPCRDVATREQGLRGKKVWETGRWEVEMELGNGDG